MQLINWKKKQVSKSVPNFINTVENHKLQFPTHWCLISYDLMHESSIKTKCASFTSCISKLLLTIVTVCNGDSGSGLTINMNNETLLLGVIYQSSKFCNPAFPLYAVSIPWYRDWIRNNTGI